MNREQERAAQRVYDLEKCPPEADPMNFPDHTVEYPDWMERSLETGERP
jgi:hypothetical protein